ncbi:MAG: protein-tyrosine phosphatase family protein [Parachlamydiales bacterium]|jgi:protein tyrosine phosphatase
MVSQVRSIDYVSQVKELNKEIDLLVSQGERSSPKSKHIRLDPSISPKIERGYTENSKLEEIKSKFKEICDLRKFNGLSDKDKAKVIKTLSKIQNNVSILLTEQKGKENTQGAQTIDNFETLNDFSQNVQEILKTAKNERDVKSYFVDDLPANDIQNFNKHIDSKTNTGIFIRPSSDKKNYTLVFSRKGSLVRVGLSLTPKGLFARELNREFPSLEELVKVLGTKTQENAINVPKTKGSQEKANLPTQDWFARIENKTTEYFKAAGVRIAMGPNTPYSRKDEDFLVPMYHAPHNRFPDVQPIFDTLVSVEVRGKDIKVHANHIKMDKFESKFMVGQATVYGEEHKFWLAVLDNNSDIIDLTTSIDDLTFNRNPFLVYPNEVGEKGVFPPVLVILQSKSEVTEGVPYTKYIYTVKNEDTGTEKTITRFHYNQWVDHQAVTPESLDHLIIAFGDISKEQFVHCKAGVGRSGTFVVAAYIKEGIDKGIITNDNLDDMLEKLVLDGRTKRGRSFVQTDNQFDLLFNYGQMLLNRKS